MPCCQMFSTKKIPTQTYVNADHLQWWTSAHRRMKVHPCLTSLQIYSRGFKQWATRYTGRGHSHLPITAIWTRTQEWWVGGTNGWQTECYWGSADYLLKRVKQETIWIWLNSCNITSLRIARTIHRGGLLMQLSTDGLERRVGLPYTCFTTLYVKGEFLYIF